MLRLSCVILLILIMRRYYKGDGGMKMSWVEELSFYIPAVWNASACISFSNVNASAVELNTKVMKGRRTT